MTDREYGGRMKEMMDLRSLRDLRPDDRRLR